MSADTDLLRKAAATPRETAAEAMPGPWENHDDGDRLICPRPEIPAGFWYVVDEPMSHAGNAAWIALANPAIAEPLAAMLEFIAAANLWPLSTDARESALHLARAILGEVTDA